MKARQLQYPSAVTVGSGLFCFLVGAVVLVGWHLRDPALVKITSLLPCMRYKTAIGFICCGLALALLALDFRRSVRALSVFPILLGVSILLEYYANLSFFPSLPTEPAGVSGILGCHPDSYAPNTGICFLLSALCLLLLSTENRGRWCTVFLALSASAILGFSLVVTLAHSVSLEPGRGIYNLTGMALHTSLCFIVLGSNILILAWRAEQEERGILPLWFPIPVGLMVAIGTFVLCKSVDLTHRTTVGRLIYSELINGFRDDLVVRLDSASRSLGRLANSLSEKGGGHKENLRKEFDLYREQYPGAKNIDFVELGDSKVSFAVSRMGVESIPEQRSLQESILAKEFQWTHKTRVFSSTFSDSDGRQNFLVMVPLSSASGSRQFLVGVFDAVAILDNFLGSSSLQGYAVEVTEAGKPIFGRFTEDKKFEAEWDEEGFLDFQDLRWKIRAWPRGETALQLTSPIVGITFIFGIALTLLVSSTVFFAQRSNFRAVQAERANEQLVLEVSQRREVEKQLVKARDELEVRVGERTKELSQTNETLRQEVRERERAEKELEVRAKELARSNGELEHFAYVASHDLQEPLRMISSFLTLLSRRCEEKIDDAGKEFIAYAVDGAKRLKVLIDDLLEFSRLGDNGGVMESSSIQGIIGEALVNLKVAIQDSNAVVHYEGMPSVLGNRKQLVRLFQNLIGNSLKFRSRTTPIIDIEWSESVSEYRFSVKDNGVGLDMVHAERIFMIFERLHSKEEYPGTGIGLAACSKIVRHHGGRIWVNSKPKEGATFHFTISKLLKPIRPVNRSLAS